MFLMVQEKKEQTFCDSQSIFKFYNRNREKLETKSNGEWLSQKSLTNW